MTPGWLKYPLVANTGGLVAPAHVTHERSGDDAASPAAINVEADSANTQNHVNVCSNENHTSREKAQILFLMWSLSSSHNKTSLHTGKQHDITGMCPARRN